MEENVDAVLVFIRRLAYRPRGVFSLVFLFLVSYVVVIVSMPDSPPQDLIHKPVGGLLHIFNKDFVGFRGISRSKSMVLVAL